MNASGSKSIQSSEVILTSTAPSADGIFHERGRRLVWPSGQTPAGRYRQGQWALGGGL